MPLRLARVINISEIYSILQATSKYVAVQMEVKALKTRSILNRDAGALDRVGAFSDLRPQTWLDVGERHAQRLAAVAARPTWCLKEK